MKTFSIEVLETLNRVIDVEAETEDEAISKVEQMYFNEEIVLDSNDMTSPVEFNVI